MKRAYQRFAALALLVVSLPVLALLAGEAEDGGPLHDQFCLGCHVSMFGGDGSAIYLRSERRVNTIEGLMGQVAFCNEQIKVGLNEYGWMAKLGERATFIALEYGTYSPERGRLVLREDHWLHAYSNAEWDAPETQRIKQQIRTHFYPDTDDWREMVLWLIPNTFAALRMVCC